MWAECNQFSWICISVFLKCGKQKHKAFQKKKNTIREFSINIYSHKFAHAFQSTQNCQLSSTRSVQSEYQVLYEYYKDIQAAALRTYITAQLSYMILHLHESGDFRNQSLAYQERFCQTNAEIQNSFKIKLQQANRDVVACDPVNYDGSL